MELTPTQAASLADDVYALTKLSSIEQALVYLKSQYHGKIAFNEVLMLKGKTGGPGIIKVRTAFGFLLVGKEGLEGNAYILFCGTQYLGDWLTNLNISTERSVCGQLVHDGFHQAFNSMLHQIEPFVNNLPVGTNVHCVGHSLGGALATIAAEWISASTLHKKPRLYSYGSPRVGLASFSKNCLSMLGENRVFRAYHKTDIVPCIPIWPYIHTPDGNGAYYLHSPGFIPGGEWHGMNHYKDSVYNKGWVELSGNKPPQKTEFGIESWLKDKTVLGCSQASLEWISDAIVYVIKKCVSVMKSVYDIAATSTFTIMDRLAYLLHEGISFEEKLSVWITLLIRKISEFLGYIRKDKESDMSKDMIRELFIRLSKKVNDIARQILSNALADGRAL